MRIFLLLPIIALLCSGCGHRYRKDQAKNPSRFTLGEVQLKIKKGMSQAEVAKALGSPNIVTKDSDGQEAWVYDKMSRSVEYYDSSGGFWVLIVGGGGTRGGATTTQDTLTVVIKFNDRDRVDNVTYHSSRF
ncbi:MAG: hypothetical protein S4CHLAM7_12760 [Chlamydiae bacterium]|nr:hypothetical protein [Chlamydiota bacterium]